MSPTREWFREYNRKRLKRFRAEGRCPMCGNFWDEDGKKTCSKCRAKNRKRYENEKKKGRCTSCKSRESRPRRHTCRICSKRLNSLGKARRVRLKAINKCRICGRRKPIKGYTSCASCLKKQNEHGRKRYRDNSESALIRGKHNRLRLKLEVFRAYGGPRCRCCGEGVLAFLSIDHINEDGAKHREQLRKPGEARSGGNIYWWLKRNDFPPGFQVLCFNCNRGKHFNGGVCPHVALQGRQKKA